MSLVAAATLTHPFRLLALRWELVDHPNVRSSHRGTIARGGGVPLIAAAIASLLIVGSPVGGNPGAAVLLGGFVLAAVGLGDDRFSVSPLVRLAMHVAAASAVVWVTGGLERLPLPPPLDLRLGAWGVGLAVLWIVAVINFYNFLDGIDGLAGIQAVVTGAGIALAGWEPLAAALGAALAGAAAGFLVHNWSPARIFLGDVGSGVLGFSFAAAPLLAPPGARPNAVLFVAVSLFLFLADAAWTVSVRVARGDLWYQAHREHLYQRLVISGWSHARVATLIGAASLVLTATALAAWRTADPGLAWGSLVLATVCFGGELALTWRRR